MKILMLVNWKIKKCSEIPEDLQAPDYFSRNEKYWFFKFFSEDTEVDIIDISSCKFWENIEKNKLHFYVLQSIKAILRIKKYDVVLSHGMPSGIVLALMRKFIKTETKHIVFDIGSFNRAAEKGKILKLNQFASKSIDGIIYHTSKQLEYYEKFYPWLVEKSIFIPFGTDLEYFERDIIPECQEENYILSIGSDMRDYDTLIEAYNKINTDIKLKIVGTTQLNTMNNANIELIARVPKRKLNELIQKSLFCVFPLEYKNFSFGQMTLLQQMYYGKCVITAKVPSMVDYVKDNDTAILYQPKNSADLREKIENVLKNKDLRKEIGIHAKKSVIEKYNEQEMSMKINQFLKKV